MSDGEIPTWAGGPVAEAATCVLAANPGPMTLDGTNTWLLHAPGSSRAVVVDPGPDDDAHLSAVTATAERLGLRIALVLLTHGHFDHSEGARALAERAGGSASSPVPVHAVDEQFRLGPVGFAAAGLGLDDGRVFDVDGLVVQTVATPGHSSDSVSFLLPEAGLMLTGDTVLGRGTTVVAHPDGRLAPYLDSIARLRDLVGERGIGRILPGHGPVLDAPAQVLEFYLAHRQARLEQVRAAVAEGLTTPRAVVEKVYADVDEQLWPAAELSVGAQLEYLGVTPPETAGDPEG